MALHCALASLQCPVSWVDFDHFSLAPCRHLLGSQGGDPIKGGLGARGAGYGVGWVTRHWQTTLIPSPTPQPPPRHIHIFTALGSS